jgi:hypothetical protein
VENTKPGSQVAVRSVVEPSGPEAAAAVADPPLLLRTVIVGMGVKLAVIVAFELPKVNVVKLVIVEEIDPPPASFSDHKENEYPDNGVAVSVIVDPGSPDVGLAEAVPPLSAHRTEIVTGDGWVSYSTM